MTSFRAFRVHKEGAGSEGVRRGVETMNLSDLPPGEVTVRVRYSSLNYKDALSASAHPGVSRSFPHTPGIDAAGDVVRSSDPRFKEGDEVIVTSYDLGMNTPGGFGQFVRVPADWVVPLPDSLGLRESMILGTAGLTAALSLFALLENGLLPEGGPVVVTGASGGVGSLAVALLAGRGFTVTASTGKARAHDWLRGLGASSVVGREALAEPSSKPLLAAQWQGGVDTVGGETLATLLKSLRWGGAVAACGLVGGTELATTVYPFILRGTRLLGVDSAACPMPRRREAWARLAGEWRVPNLERMTEVIGLDGLEGAIQSILAGEVQGRVLLDLGA